MKTYTGFEAIERMQTHWITKAHPSGERWKFVDGVLKNESKFVSGSKSILSINFFFENVFFDYNEPLELEEGEMFVVEGITGKYYAVLEEEQSDKFIHGICVRDNKVISKSGYFLKGFNGRTLRKATDEELQGFERLMVFHKKGRKMEEFRLGDIGEHEDILYKVVVQTEDNKFEGVIGCVAINEKDAPVKYFPANSVELQFCVEDMVGEIFADTSQNNWREKIGI